MEFETGGTAQGLLASGSLPPHSDAVRLVAGHAADHRLIYELLRTSPLAPSADSFSSSLEDPSYEPTDRLLVKRGTQLLGHVQLVHRCAWFHGVKLPITSVDGLVTLPELRDAGYDRLLFSAAEQSLRSTHAVVAFAHTDRVELFRAAGWSELAQPRHTEANVHEVLAGLAAHHETPWSLSTRRERPLRIRHWRHVELEPLLEVARQAAAATWGGLDRNEAYWRWLVGRKTHDALIVAIDGPDDWDALHVPSHIIGYAVTRGSQLMELGATADLRAVKPLLARACQDAIERDYRAISLHSPPLDPLHDALLSAGGRWCARPRHDSWLVKLLDPVRWVEAMYPVLLERAKAAELARPLAIGFDIGRRRYRFELTRRSGHMLLDDSVASDVTCSPSTLSALLVGHLDLKEARQTGRVYFTNDEIAARIAALFPQVAFWQSPFDAM